VQNLTSITSSLALIQSASCYATVLESLQYKKKTCSIGLCNLTSMTSSLALIQSASWYAAARAALSAFSAKRFCSSSAAFWALLAASSAANCATQH
jgi:hypothetical protein